MSSDLWGWSHAQFLAPVHKPRQSLVTGAGSLLLNPGAEPWTLAGAALVDSAGEQVELARWPLAPIPANGAGAVVVGIKGERAQLGCPCTLKLWEATGPRTFTLGNVEFPVSQQAGP